MEGHYISYTIIRHCLSLSLSVALIFGLYRPSSGPIALRNVLKCSICNFFTTIRFCHFSSAAFIEKNVERVPMASDNNVAYVRLYNHILLLQIIALDR